MKQGTEATNIKRDVAIGRALLLTLVALALLTVLRLCLVWSIRQSSGASMAPLHVLASTVARMGGDGAFIALVTGIVIALVVLGMRRPALWLHQALLLVTLVAAAANVRFTEYYGQPASLGLLHFSGIHGWESLIHISSYLRFGDVVLLCTPAGLFLVASAVSRNRRLRALLVSRWFSLPALASVIGAMMLITVHNNDQGLPVHQNAIVWFVSTALAQPMARPPHALRDPALPFQVHPTREAPVVSAGTLQQAGVRNVVLVALESTGDVYLQGSERAQILPQITRNSNISAEFRSAYASTAQSFVSLYVMMSGRYPRMQSDPLPASADRAAMPTLIGELMRHGYRTAAFFSAPWVQSGYADFLKEQRMPNLRQGVDQPECHNERAPGIKQIAWRTAPDECTFRAATNWMKQSPQPFFALIWTDQTHYPYHVLAQDGSERSSGPDDAVSMKARYIAAIHNSDRLIGGLLNDLKSAGLLETTLVVVIGDHGEAFQQHGRFVHGYDVFEENVRVPLVFINPRLFHGAVNNDPVSQIDLAPTVLDALQIRSSVRWDGQSLFSGKLRDRTYMISPWGAQIGIRAPSGRYNYDIPTGELQPLPYLLRGMLVETPQPSPADAAKELRLMWNWIATIDWQYDRMRASAGN